MKIDLSFCFVPVLFSLPAPQAPYDNPQPPSFELQLSLAELSFLQSSAVAGVEHYGGDADYTVKFSKEGDVVQAQLTVKSKLLMDVWTYWVNEHLADNLMAVDLEALDPAAHFALATGKAVRRKLGTAKEDPRFDSVAIQGKLELADDGAVLVTSAGRLQLRSQALLLTPELAENEVLVQGSIREQDVLTVDSLRGVKPNTLDLFVMSHCPFGRRASRRVVEGLLQSPESARPEVKLHYVFYEKADAVGDEPFWSLHGEEEIQENLVQSVLQEQYPSDVFLGYLLQRSSSDADWKELAVKVGLAADDIDVVSYRIENERAALIRREYESATRDFGVHDGSPVYFWEGREVTAAAVPFLRALPEDAHAGNESCSASG